MSTILTIIGLGMIYAMAHFSIVQFKKTYEDRTTYEKVITWIGLISFILITLNAAFSTNTANADSTVELVGTDSSYNGGDVSSSQITNCYNVDSNQVCTSGKVFFTVPTGSSYFITPKPPIGVTASVGSGCEGKITTDNDNKALICHLDYSDTGYCNGKLCNPVTPPAPQNSPTTQEITQPVQTSQQTIISAPQPTQITISTTSTRDQQIVALQKLIIVLEQIITLLQKNN